MKTALLFFTLAAGLLAQTVTNPNCPSATAAAGVTPHCAIFNWSAPASGSIPTGYNIYRATSTGTCKPPFTAVACIKVTSTPVAALTFTDNSSATNILSEGVTYFYVATSVSASGESAPTAEVSGTFPALLPGTPQSFSGVFR